MEKTKRRKAPRRHSRTFGIGKAGTTYYCAECGTEVQAFRFCPHINPAINWVEVIGQYRPC